MDSCETKVDGNDGAWRVGRNSDPPPFAVRATDGLRSAEAPCAKMEAYCAETHEIGPRLAGVAGRAYNAVQEEFSGV